MKSDRDTAVLATVRNMYLYPSADLPDMLGERGYEVSLAEDAAWQLDLILCQ